MKLSDYDVPKTTSLIFIGPKGSGKSSLVNRISKVLENDKFASERAQLTHNSSVGDGTYYLREYMMPRGSNSFCLYDTCSLGDDTSDNINMIKHWITKGVRHGELIIRKSDCSILRNRMKCKARENGCEPSELRMVNFVVFVLNAIAVLKSMEDDKPVVVVTHGDLLSPSDRACIRTYHGELLRMPPAKQIFDIPESCDPENELVIVDMLRYCLEHADRNLPSKNCARSKVFRLTVVAFVHLLIIMGAAILSLKMQRFHTLRASKSNPHVDWRVIRHMWL